MKTFGFMFAALLITAFAASTVTPTVFENMMQNYSLAFFLIIIAEVVIVIVSNKVLQKNNVVAAAILYTVYSYLTVENEISKIS